MPPAGDHGVARFWLAVAPATGPSPNPWPAAKARRTAGPSNPRLTVWPLGLEYGPDANLAFVASLMADRHRAQMLLTLLGGTPQSGSALAEAVGISRSLASAHLKKLVTGGLVRAQPSGRQQLYSIASAPVADALGRRGKWARRAGEPLEAASRISHSK